jgi:CRISPR-associated protein Csm1
MTDRRPLPTPYEVAIGAHLHDIGKFMQRAIGDVDILPETVRNRISDVLPVFDGRHTHFHALFSDAFFDECVDAHPLPAELDKRWIRDCAVYHHRPLNDGVALPNGAITYLVTEADRISAAMEREKKKDADQESSPDRSVRDKYRRTRLVAAPSAICLKGRGEPKRQYYPISEISPQSLFELTDTQLGTDIVTQYVDEWKRFKAAYAELAERTKTSLEGYIEGLIALSERFCWSVPSSTIDDPDVSLHDHGRVAAAVAACLYQHHDVAGDLKDEAAVRDRGRRKFRLLTGDLSGIQATLFRLQSENVKGLARLLRGRSFRMQLITEAGARRACQTFGLPLYNIIQLAGGRFLLILPETGPGQAEERTNGLRKEIDEWMLQQYVGDLVLNLGLTEPLSADDLIHNLGAVYAKLGAVAETAKLRPLSTQAYGVVTLPFDTALEICTACGVRPATERDRLDEAARCPACAAETELGRNLPKAEAIAIRSTARAGDQNLIFGLEFEALKGDRPSDVTTGFRRRPTEIAEGRPAADRFFEAYTPKHTAVTLQDERLAKARQETGDDEDPKEGELLTFAELAALSTEKDKDDRPIGQPMLALLKADVDNLGKVFTEGLGDRRSLSRTAALSRLMDAFFTGWLPDHLRERFPNLYTVYAGGDDMMVLGPWFDVLRFAPSLRTAFGQFSGGNPSLTLSAGIELFDPKTPISLAAARAEERLDAAKHCEGKDRISAIGPAGSPMTWREWEKAIEQADELHRLIEAGKVSTSLLYRLLSLEDRRRKAKTDPACADWRAKLGYTLYRSVKKEAMSGNQSVRDRLLGLMGVDPKLVDTPDQPYTRVAITIALYRNR